MNKIDCRPYGTREVDILLPILRRRVDNGELIVRMGIATLRGHNKTEVVRVLLAGDRPSKRR